MSLQPVRERHFVDSAWQRLTCPGLRRHSAERSQSIDDTCEPTVLTAKPDQIGPYPERENDFFAMPVRPPARHTFGFPRIIE